MVKTTTTTTLQHVVSKLKPRRVALTTLNDFKGFRSKRRHDMLVAALELGVERGIIGRQVVEGGHFGYYLEKGGEKEGLGCHVEKIRIVGTQRVVEVKRSMRLQKTKKGR